MKNLYLTLLVLFFGISTLSAQDDWKVEVRNPDVIQGVFHGETAPLATYKEDPNAPNEVNRGLKLGYSPKHDWPLHDFVNPNALPQGPDPAWQKEYTEANTNRNSSIIQNFEGLPYAPLNPPDPVMDVGPNHIIQMTNNSSGARFQVWDKTGTILVASTQMDNFFNSAIGGSGAFGKGDPIVLYDQLADRWFMAEFSNVSNDIYILVSTTADPLGAWFAYTFTAPNFPDYLKFSIWPNVYTMTSNESGPSAIYAFDRIAMLAGGPTTLQRFTVPDYPTIGFQATTPVGVEGPTAPPAGNNAYFMRMADDAWSGAIPADRLEIYELDVDFVTPANSVFSGPNLLPTDPFDTELCGYTSFSCMDQPSGTDNLDPLREVLMFKVQYRNFGTHESIVCNHVTDVDGTDRGGVRWYELRRTGGGPWSIYQQGTYSPDADDRWMGAININAAGQIGLLFNRSSSTTFPGIYYTGRNPGDPLGTMTVPEGTIVTGGGSNGSIRYGDYNSLSVDPTDEMTFWGTAEYNPAPQWSTRITAFSIAPPACNIANPVAITTSSEFCSDGGVGNAQKRVRVQAPSGADETVVWTLTDAPTGSQFDGAEPMEFFDGDANSEFRLTGGSKGNTVTMRGEPKNSGTPVYGTWTFEVRIEDTSNGCISGTETGYSLTAYEQPTVMIAADPSGDLCLGTMGVQYDATIASTDGGTYSYAWCAYNSGDGSGTCFNGFSDNTAQMPTRNWTSSAGPKSVGVTVTSDVPGCSAEDLYSFEVVAPTMLACPADLTATLITDDVTFDCEAIATFNNPTVMPGPCDPVTLTISVDGGTPEVVTPGDPYTATFDELGDYDVTYVLVDAVGNTSTCSFTITVDGLPCGWVDNGGIGCGGNSSDYDLPSETFTLDITNCAPVFPYTADQTAFVFTELCGDGEIIARVSNIQGTGFAGVMMRESEDPGARKMAIGTNGVNRVQKEVRVLPNYPSWPQLVLSYDQIWVRVTREGNTFRGFASPDAMTWFPYLFQQIQMPDCIRVGLYLYSEKPDSPMSADFNDVFVTGLNDMSLAQGAPATFLNGTTIQQTPTVEIYPNPAASQITLDMTNFIGQQADIRLFNQMGQLVQQTRIDEVQFAEQLEVSALNPGVYTVVVKVGEELISKRLVIARP